MLGSDLSESVKMKRSLLLSTTALTNKRLGPLVTRWNSFGTHNHWWSEPNLSSYFHQILPVQCTGYTFPWRWNKSTCYCLLSSNHSPHNTRFFLSSSATGLSTYTSLKYSSPPSYNTIWLGVTRQIVHMPSMHHKLPVTLTACHELNSLHS